MEYVNQALPSRQCNTGSPEWFCSLEKGLHFRRQPLLLGLFLFLFFPFETLGMRAIKEEDGDFPAYGVREKAAAWGGVDFCVAVF